MKKLLSTNYSAGAFNFAMLVLRLGVGILMMHHGYEKLKDFNGMLAKGFAPSFLGLSPSISLALDIFAEFFCSIFLIIGLFTRFSVIPLIIAMSVAFFQAHHGDAFGMGERAALYLTGFLVLLLVGPGRISVDSMIGK